jgi:hypothetical protein
LRAVLSPSLLTLAMTRSSVSNAAKPEWLWLG